MPYFSPFKICSVSQRISPYLPGCCPCSASTVDVLRGPVCCLTLTHAHTHTRIKSQKLDKMGFTETLDTSPTSLPFVTERNKSSNCTFTFSPPGFISSELFNTHISSLSQIPRLLRTIFSTPTLLQCVMLNFYLSLLNKRIRVTKHCTLDHIMRQSRGIRGFCVTT